MGRFIHLDWRARKARNKQYSGCTMTLSFVPTNEEKEQTLISAQSIDLKLSIPIETYNLKTLKELPVLSNNLMLKCS